ncbi:MAG: hypothetical protein ACI8Y4_001258 [Candidatus Poriferisodalaceae bacterium]|jgi:hypothetical protein
MDAEWRQGDRAGSGSSFAYSTTDWTEAWGYWSVEISDLPPGSCSLRIGNGSPTDDVVESDRYMSLVFNIS